MILKTKSEETTYEKVGLEKIAEIVCDVSNISIENMVSKTRRRHYTYPRHIYCYIAIKIYGFSYEGAAHFVGRHHATSIHSCQMVMNLSETLPSFNELYTNCLVACLQTFGVPPDHPIDKIDKLGKLIQKHGKNSTIVSDKLDVINLLIAKKENQLNELKAHLSFVLKHFRRRNPENARPVEHRNDSVGDIS